MSHSDLPAEKNLGGRPRKELDQEQFEAICRMNPTLKDVAAFFKVDQDTIIARCKDWGYTGFSDARDQNMVASRLDLIRSAVKHGKNGNAALLIFSLKNLCGWTDKQETNVSGEIKMPINEQDKGL